MTTPTHHQSHTRIICGAHASSHRRFSARATSSDGLCGAAPALAASNTYQSHATVSSIATCAAGLKLHLCPRHHHDTHRHSDAVRALLSPLTARLIPRPRTQQRTCTRWGRAEAAPGTKELGITWRGCQRSARVLMQPDDTQSTANFPPKRLLLQPPTSFRSRAVWSCRERRRLATKLAGKVIHISESALRCTKREGCDGL